MTPDLFADFAPLSEQTSEQNRAERGARMSSGPLVKSRHSGTPGYRPRSGRITGQGGARGQDFTNGPESRARTSGLLDLRACLETEIEKIEPVLSDARATEAPFKEEFYAAHHDLEALHILRTTGQRPVEVDEMLAGYDLRLHAGRAWHPFKKAAEDLQRWLKEVRRELKAVNKEIGV